ncbi:type II toxin-antitoxin system HicA family toxin [Hymenobacter guriensis]|uniref:Type II toxin-antitoxin system HicA family toxin n=1 Tax=Hymenobacter guriensis TaxID=2793065 RepID=A0ABS0KYZ6_9BACT|nr:type II toxin-antitoxin system HicA family toxin [Hymenobacter guriensis]MBG8553069.1 type II toxin-antitoxin system HicA family toxin [Hymenobacter guriensis]
MKSKDLLKILFEDGWYILRQAKGSHMKLAHLTKRSPKTADGCIVFSFHGSDEVGKGAESDILKQAGLK